MTIHLLSPDGFESWLFDAPIYKPNDEQYNKYFVISFSGGKDSTALLLKLLEYDIWIDEVIYVDIGKEMPEMIKHINKIKKLVTDKGIKFTRLKSEKDWDYYFYKHIKTKGKNKGEKGYGWPGFGNRWCTKHLKIETLKKYYKKLENEYETVEFIGYAADEINRTKKNDDNRTKEFPLILWDMEEENALNYCYLKGYDWDGLYEKFDRVSCYLCPMSRLSELKYIFNNYPWLWLEMRMYDDASKWDFRNDYTLRELEYKFIREYYQDLWGYKQLSLFDKVAI